MNRSRRILIRRLAAGAATLPLGALFCSRALAADAEHLKVEDPAARSLNYTHQSADAARRCGGCQFYSGDAGADWGPCVIFPGKLVKASGVCSSWYARAG